MDSVIVQRVGVDGTWAVPVALGPGEQLAFGRGAPGHPVGLELPHPEVPRMAGCITAVDDHWALSNLSHDRTYVVENPEGGGEHVKIAPRRLDAPIPFELARLVLPVTAGRAELLVFAPQHAYATAGPGMVDGEATAAGFALDETAKYFLVLVALSEPRLRDPASAAVPSVPAVVDRLAPLPACRGLSRSAVNFHIDYLAHTKLRLREFDEPERRRRVDHKRAALASFAIRFDLVREDHLALLPRAPRR